MALTDSLVDAWEMEDASGNATGSHAGLTLTETGGTIPATTGKPVGARDFEAIDTEWFERADEAALSLGNIDFTWAAWVNAESLGANRSIIMKGNASSLEAELRYINSVTMFSFRVASGAAFANLTAVNATTFGTPSTATWYWLLAQHDATGNTIGMSVNNGTLDTAAYTFGSYDSTAPFRVGAYSDFSEYWDGPIGQVLFWKRLLTSDEKASVYNSGNGLSYSSFGGGATAAKDLLRSNLLKSRLLKGLAV
jgi:hypothetical protein